MEKISIKLPAKQGLELKFVKGCLAKIASPPYTIIGRILHINLFEKFRGSIKNIFEHKKFGKILGINLAALFLSSSLIQFPFEESQVYEESFVAKAPFVLDTKKSIQYPVEEIKITQGYKMFHTGIDFDGTTGNPIRPIKDGIVEAINYSKYAYGNAILIDHGNEITTLYAHLSKILVVPNQEVTTETIIGEMGSTGRSSGDHLHLEIRDNGIAFNPLTVLPK